MHEETGVGALTWELDIWKATAKEALGETRFYKDGIPTTFILYNKWLTDEGYRREIGAELNLGKYVDPDGFVPSQGGGSSFDSMEFQFRGMEMDTLQRWRVMFRNPHFGPQVYYDAELWDLSERLFDFRPED